MRDVASDPGGHRGRRDRQRSGLADRVLRRLGSAVDARRPLLNNAAVGASPAGAYQVAGPVGFSPNDIIAVVQGANCTLSTINAGGVSVAVGTGIATISHTLTSTPATTTLRTTARRQLRWSTSGRETGFGRTLYSVDPANTTMRAQSLLPTVLAATPVASNVVNLKAQFGTRHRRRRTGRHMAVRDRQLVVGQPSVAACHGVAADPGGAGRNRHPQRKVRDRCRSRPGRSGCSARLLLVRSR